MTEVQVCGWAKGGGGRLLGPRTNPKVRRPIDSKLPLHLVLKSQQSVLRLPKTYRLVSMEIRRWAAMCGVKIFKVAVEANHIHLAIQVKKRQMWKRFIRGLSGSIARKLMCLGYSPSGRSKSKGFWRQRPFTRVVRSWRQAFKNLVRYVEMNEWEAAGNLDRKDRGFLKDLRRMWREDADLWLESTPLGKSRNGLGSNGRSGPVGGRGLLT